MKFNKINKLKNLIKTKTFMHKFKMNFKYENMYKKLLLSFKKRTTVFSKLLTALQATFLENFYKI